MELKMLETAEMVSKRKIPLRALPLQRRESGQPVRHGRGRSTARWKVVKEMFDLFVGRTGRRHLPLDFTRSVFEDEFRFGSRSARRDRRNVVRRRSMRHNETQRRSFLFARRNFLPLFVEHRQTKLNRSVTLNGIFFCTFEISRQINVEGEKFRCR